MRRIWIIAWNDIRQTAKDRPSLFWMIIMPVAFIYLFGSLGGGGDRSPRVALGLVDQDHSFLSRHFSEALTREGFRVEPMTPAEADSSHGPPRHVRIPIGFQDSVALGRPVNPRLLQQPDADASATITAEMHIQRAIIQTLTDLVRASKGREPPLVFDAAFESTFTAIASQPDRITVRSEAAGQGRPVPRGRQHSLPGTITLFMLINTAIYGAVFLTQERQDHVLARTATYPVSRNGILAGKLLGRTLLGLLQAAILLAAGRFLLGVYLGNSLIGMTALIIAISLTVASMSLFWGAVLRRPEQATAIALVSSLFLGAIGGCWWPLEVVPGWMRTAGHLSPAAWAMDGLHALISFGAGPEAVMLPSVVLLGYAAIFTAIGARLLRFTD